MAIAREQVTELANIDVEPSPYDPLQVDADLEKSKAVLLLNRVKEAFGGGADSGRCFADDTPKKYSDLRLNAANRDNFDFKPIDISNEDLPIDNSHIWGDEDDYVDNNTEDEGYEYDPNGNLGKILKLPSREGFSSFFFSFLF